MSGVLKKRAAVCPGGCCDDDEPPLGPPDDDGDDCYSCPTCCSSLKIVGMGKEWYHPTDNQDDWATRDLPFEQPVGGGTCCNWGYFPPYPEASHTITWNAAEHRWEWQYHAASGGGPAIWGYKAGGKCPMGTYVPNFDVAFCTEHKLNYLTEISVECADE